MTLRTTEQAIEFDAELLKAIGKIALAHERLEHWMRKLIGALISDDHTLGDIISIPLPTRQLCPYLLALFDYRSQNQARVDEFRELVGRAAELIDKRHEVVHAIWETNPMLGSAELVRQRLNIRGKKPKDRGVKRVRKKYTLDQLNSIAYDIHSVSSKLLEMTAYLVEGKP